MIWMDGITDSMEPSKGSLDAGMLEEQFHFSLSILRCLRIMFLMLPWPIV